MIRKSILTFLASVLLLTPLNSMAVTLECRFKETAISDGFNETFIYDPETERLLVADGRSEFYPCTEQPGMLTCVRDKFHSSSYRMGEKFSEYKKRGVRINRSSLEIEVLHTEYQGQDPTYSSKAVYITGRGKCSVVKQQF